MVARSVADDPAEDCDNEQATTANSHAASARLPQTTELAITTTSGSSDNV